MDGCWDKDSDMLVMSTNKAKIDNILQSNNISFKHQKDGIGPVRAGLVIISIFPGPINI